MTPYKDLAIRYPPTKPMPMAEQDRLVALAKDGDEKARNALIEQYMPMILYVIEKQKWAYRHREDLVGDCVVDMCRYINSYDKDDKRMFSTYLWNGLNMSLKTSRKSIKRRQGCKYNPSGEAIQVEVCSLDTTIGEATGHAAGNHDETMIESIACETDYFEMSDMRIEADVIRKTLDQFSGASKSIMMLRYFNPDGFMTMNEVGNMLGITKAGVSYRENKTIRRIRKILGIHAANQD